MKTDVVRLAVVMTAALALPAAARAQTPAPAAQPPAAKAEAPKPDLPAPPANFEYAAEGRRDPFVSLINRGEDAARTATGQPVKRAEGVPGLMTSEIVVKGIVQTRAGYVAMITGIDGKVFTLRAGDKLADGVVRQVAADAVVILQEVNDPLSLAKQREVRKLLRGGEEVK
jgi:Tfp pilus assembly protein PilP